MRIDMSGLRLGEAGEALKKAAAVGLVLGGEDVLRVSNQRVPHEEGDLERTGAVVLAEPLKAAVSYRDVAYKGQAVDQHENMTYKHDPGRGPKYLETAMAERRDAVLEAIAGQLRKATGG